MAINNVKNGDIIGFKYFGFGGLEDNIYGLRVFDGTKIGNLTNINIFLRPLTIKEFKINIWLDGPWDNDIWKGKKIGEVFVKSDSNSEITKFKLDVSKYVDGLKGKHAVYLTTESDVSEPLYNFIGIGFSNKNREIDFPGKPSIRIIANGKDMELPYLPERTNKFNGLTGCNVYRIKYEISKNEKIPVIKAFSDNKDVEINIKQAESVSDDAIVMFNYHGVKKIYVIDFTI